MLTFKRYKELKARRNDLNLLNISCKMYMKFYQRSSFFSMSHSFKISISKNNIELNYINELLRMHKILWKQYLAVQPKKCQFCKVPCLNDHCSTKVK